MSYTPANIKLHIACLRIGGQLSPLLLSIALLLCARLLPAPDPNDTAQHIAERFADNATGIRIGMTLILLGTSAWVLWGATVAAWARQIEVGSPILSYALIASVAISEVIVIMIAVVWALAAFRPGQVSPDITLTLNDAGWLLFLIPWAPFSMWCVTVGLLILQDKSSNPVLPRWMAGASFCFAFILIPAFAPLMFKTGGFAYDAVLGMYIPLVAFEGWKTAVTVTMIRGLKKQSQSARGEPDGARTQSDLVLSQTAGDMRVDPSRDTFSDRSTTEYKG